MNSKVTEQSGLAFTQGMPLSIPQERLWVLDQLHTRNAVQNLACGLRFTETVDGEALESALGEVAQRHEILRTEFHAVEGAPVQVVLSTVPVKLNIVDLRELPAQEREKQLLRRAQQEMQNPFDLLHAPLLRAILFQLTETEHVLLAVVHRIVCDEASLRLLLSEITSRYHARGRDEFQAGLEPPLQYRAIAARDAEPSASQLLYWTKQLEGAPSSVDLPTDRQRPPVQTFQGGKQRMSIEPQLAERIKSLAQSRGTDLFTSLLAAFAVLLSRYSRQDDIVVGTRVSGRERPELEKLIGPLENMLALRMAVSGEMSFADFLIHVHEVTEKASLHQQVLFETLVKQMRLGRDMSRQPLFQIMFSMQDADAAGFSTSAGVSLFAVESAAEQFDLSVEYAIKGNGIEATFSYSSDLFDAATIQRMMGHFHVLLEAAAGDPGIKLANMPMLSGRERHQLLVEWNDTAVDYRRVDCVHGLFERQVKSTPHSDAVTYNNQSLTYQKLNQQANRLAHHLRKLGVGPDALVGICLERGFDMIVALLAVLKAGGAYLPLDPAYPKERLQFMLEDSSPAVLLTQADLRGLFTGIDDRMSVLNVAAAEAWKLEPETDLDPASMGLTPTHLAYVIYTSGSTGAPKGVMVEHANVTRLFAATDAWFRFDASDVWTLFHSYAFDFSVWEIWGALFYGGRVVIVPKDVARSPQDFYQLLCQEKVTVLNQTPSAFRQLISAQARTKESHRLRYVVFGGEALETATLKPWYEQNQGQNTQLINMYGITETTVHVTYRPLTPADTEKSGGSPVGCRIPDLRTYILDGQRQPVPVGVVGELYVGGAGVARGYLNRPELTAQRFLRDPFVGNSEERMYKTGDLGRWLEQGEIEFFGRNDSQVKIRGFRIELGEIEARLAEKTGVQEVVVTVREDTPGDKRLVAYYTCSDEPVSAEILRAHLSARLPEHMVPAAYVRLESLPLTTNGKLDRKALPAPNTDDYGVRGYEAPAGQVEEAIAKVWGDILKVQRVGRRDNFFELGGHSLMAGRLLAQLNEITGRKIPLSAMFRGATVESLAQLIQQESETGHDPVAMAIQPGESGRLPFFAIVPPGEESLGYAMLARHMGAGQTVYKIQGHAPVLHGKRPYSAEEMKALAEEYIAAMRAVQPHGPYCVGGLCDGTHIAEQIVLSLEARGEEIGLFAIFDTWVLQHSQRRWLWKIYYYGQRLREMKSLSLGKRLAFYRRVAHNKVGNVLGKSAPRKDWSEAYWPEDFTPRQFQAPVILFKRPKQQFYYVKDPQMGWGARTRSGVEIWEIDFHHLEILREPHVREFGEILKQAMGRVGQRNLQPQLPTEDHQGSRFTVHMQQGS
ncbi:MAG TPA: amino acid adenylation domain-containing protein [Candidatus Deferrimicrobiaceae bacterium]|nr:amino acid adenylation domain-containing protein [Candidatus Deferrimicrobiaceae bacterium]